MKAALPLIIIWLYAWISAFLTAFGRFGSYPGVSSRYIAVANLAWISIIFFVAIYVEKKNKKTQFYVILLMYFLVFSSLLSDLGTNYSQIINHYENLKYAKHQIVCGLSKDDKIFELIYPKAKVVKLRISYLKKYNLSFLTMKNVIFKNIFSPL